MNNISGFSSTTRITGLMGLDTDSLVQQLMQAERIPLDSLYQKRTLVEWKRDAYREVINRLRGLKSTFFDIVNRSSYILSASAIKVLSARTGSNTYLEVSANADAQIGTHQVKVIQLATGDTAISRDPVSRSITGKVSENLNLAGKSILVNLDGVSREIALEDYSLNENSENYIVTRLQDSLDKAFGEGKLVVGFDSGLLTIGTTGGATRVTVDKPASGAQSGLEALGLSAGDSNRIKLGDTLENLQDKLNLPLEFNENGEVQFSINGKLITAKKTETLSKVLDRINNTTEANVTIKYDELSDKLTLASKVLGQGDNLIVEDIGGNFLAAFGLSDDRADRTEGQDARIIINGTQEVVRSTNQFTINGVSYNLKAAHPEDSDGEQVTLELDVDKAYENIKSFVDKYNELIDYLNGKLSEKYDRDYPPLTDAQKKEMKDSDIENWEKVAKTGLLRNDDIIYKMVTAMRTAMYEPVEGSSLTMKDIGIGTTSYLDGGRLTIDEAKLREALRNNPDEVAKLLNGVDPDNKTYSRTATAEQRKSRYSKSGIFQRISDILEDNISIYRDSNGNKGTLLEKAGIEGDITFNDNLLNDELKNYDKRISALTEKLIAKEEYYYRQFTALERYLAQMNAQSAWLMTQFGQNR
ncbi:MAG TPA: flagellar filament capping protein FliD [Thermoclostridium sp.]|nr:flagellar filament capping protein FliD [Thermoclostridium sp.]HPU45494.1 flagellar filament capping protein FliD [Thermoclostridium sp.]